MGTLIMTTCGHFGEQFDNVWLAKDDHTLGPSNVTSSYTETLIYFHNKSCKRILSTALF